MTRPQNIGGRMQITTS